MLLAAVLAAACPARTDAAPAAGPPGKPKGPMTFPVEVAPVDARRVAYSVSAVGSVLAFEEVLITARVAGTVEQVRFQEGDTVAQGAVLAEIDTDRFAVAADAARASHARAEAVLADARETLARRKDAQDKHPGMYPEEELQLQQTRVRTAEADLAAAAANLRAAELNVRDARVRAPMGGVVQARSVSTGQYVQPGAVLGTLLRRDPLRVRFDVPEADAARVEMGSALTFTVRGQPHAFQAQVTHVAAAASETTRTVAITARVTDTERALLRPGSFVQVSVPVGTPVDAPVVPQTAVRPSEKGFLAYVVDGEVAHERVLQLGLRTEDGRVEVRSGLQAGEMLVIRGAEALREGAKVRVVKPGEVTPARGRETPVVGGAAPAANAAADAGPGSKAL